MRQRAWPWESLRGGTIGEREDALNVWLSLLRHELKEVLNGNEANTSFETLYRLVFNLCTRGLAAHAREVSVQALRWAARRCDPVRFNVVAQIVGDANIFLDTKWAAINHKPRTATIALQLYKAPVLQRWRKVTALVQRLCVIARCHQSFMQRAWAPGGVSYTRAHARFEVMAGQS